MRGMSLVVLALTAAGCATSAVVRASTLPECSAAGAPAEWLQVKVEDLTFCVPESWRSAGPRSWRGAGGRIQWAWGQRVREVASTVVVVMGSPPTREQAAAALPVSPVQRTMETVGGELVDVWISEVEGAYRTGADWQTGRTMHMTGEATSLSAAERQLDAFRSVRLVQR